MKQTHIHKDTEVYIIPLYLHGDQIHLQSYVLLNSIFEASKMQGVREAKQTLHCIMYDRTVHVHMSQFLELQRHSIYVVHSDVLLYSQYPTTNPYSKPV
jgi:hypothetical protein